MKSRLLFSDILNQLSFALCIVKKNYQIVMVNESFTNRMFDVKEKIVGQNLIELFSSSGDFLKRKIDTVFIIESPTFSSWQQNPHVLPIKTARPVSGLEEEMFQDLEFIPVHSENGQLEHVCICIYDSTNTATQTLELKRLSEELASEHSELERALKNLKSTQSQLLQSEKLASIGQLSAGIAHEINNPIGFITSNMQTLDNYFEKFKSVVSDYQKLIEESESKRLIEKSNGLSTQYQIEFLIEDVSDLISESLEGSDRVMKIVRNLKEFSHLDNSGWKNSNVISGMESTIKIISNELKYKAKLVKEYDESIPEIYCQPMQLNQVFLNLLVNASQAIKDEGTITIRVAKRDESNLAISIEDNGEGIPSKLIEKIFDPFFTTKPVGTGTGLGLSVSYGIIKEHSGEITVESELGKGTKFTISLPMKLQEHFDE